MYSPFYCFTVYKKNERTVSDLNRQCLMRIIPIYWGQLDQRGIKGVVEHYKILQKYDRKDL